MEIMGTDNIIFLENLEWFDNTGKELVHRLPQKGSGEIKYGAQLTVRESQAAVFFYKGKALDAFGPGRHTLKTANIPILTKILSLPWGLSSPLRAEVYFINLKVFTNLKWGTRDPVAFKDSELGLIRLRAFGVFNLQVMQPVLFINNLVGTQGIYTTEEIDEYLNRVIVSRFNDYMGETIDSILNLPARYDDLSENMVKRVAKDFSSFGLGITHLYINAITPPPEVQQAIDDRSRMGVFEDMNKLMQMKAQPQATQTDTSKVSLCPDCSNSIPIDAKFCPFCGHQQLVFKQCVKCGKNLTPSAKFCSRCGQPAEGKPEPKRCSKCGSENVAESMYCNQCGEQL
jgi:membrane protease subunit (stomatin/prohibitin family)